MKTPITNLAKLNGCSIQLGRTKGALALDGVQMFFVSNSESWAGAWMTEIPSDFTYSCYLFSIQYPEECRTRAAFSAEVLDLCDRK